MIALPPALSPWRAQLDLFDPEVTLSLGPLVARLALALGPFRAEGGSPGGEPDGYDGLSRRGSYERLLMSEWLLAEELPEEFLRRAAAGEHSFVRLAHQGPAATRRSMALLDPGPDQLGAPRIAQLAALLALAARAEKAGARFGWGILQGATFYEEPTEASLGRLLDGRAVRDVTEADLLTWQERLGAPQSRDDLWLIGGRRLAALELARGASLLRIEDVLHPVERSLRVTVHGRSRPPTSIELPLPPPPQCVRVLRDPFRARVTARSPPTAPSSTVASNLLFSTRGQHLLSRLADGSLWAQPIPNSAAATPGHPVVSRLLGGEQLIAAGIEQRRTSLLVLRHGRPVLRYTGRRGGPSGEPTELRSGAGREPWLDPGKRLLPLIIHRVGLGARRGDEHFVLTADGRLHTLLEGSTPVLMAEGVAAVAPFHGLLAWVAEADGHGQPRRIEIHDGFQDRMLPIDLSGDGPLEAYLGFGGGFNSPDLRGIAAVRVARSVWRLVYGGQSGDAFVSEGGVVGVARDGEHGGAPSLVVLRPDRRSLWLVGSSSEEKISTSIEEISEVTCSHTDAQVAWLTRSGEVVVWSLDQRAALLRLHPGAAP